MRKRKWTRAQARDNYYTQIDECSHVSHLCRCITLTFPKPRARLFVNFTTRYFWKPRTANFVGATIRTIRHIVHIMAIHWPLYVTEGVSRLTWDSCMVLAVFFTSDVVEHSGRLLLASKTSDCVDTSRRRNFSMSSFSFSGHSNITMWPASSRISRVDP